MAWAAGLVAGAAYAVFPFHLHLGIEILHHTITWAMLPLPFLVYERALQQNKLGATTGIVLGVVIAAMGVVDIEHPLIVAPFLALYLILRILPDLGRRWQGALAMLLMAALVALGLVAFYVLPAATEIGQVGVSARFGEGGTANEQFAAQYGVVHRDAPGRGRRSRRRHLPSRRSALHRLRLLRRQHVVCGAGRLCPGCPGPGPGAALVRSGPGRVAPSAGLCLVGPRLAAGQSLPQHPLLRLSLRLPRHDPHRLLPLPAGRLRRCLAAGIPRRPVAWAALAGLAIGVLVMDRPRPTVSYLAVAAGLLLLLAAIVLLAANSHGRSWSCRPGQQGCRCRGRRT